MIAAVAPRTAVNPSQLSHVYPLGTRVNERGHLELGGCDAVELAREFGTPAYVVVEDDIRTRARGFVGAYAARCKDFETEGAPGVQSSPASRDIDAAFAAFQADDLAPRLLLVWNRLSGPIKRSMLQLMSAVADLI